MARRPHEAIPAGLVDAATSSLATFALGLFAARLEPEVVGAYALYFASLRLLQSVSNQLVFLPIEIGAVARREPERLALFPASLRAGVPVAAAAALFAALTHFMLPAGSEWGVTGPLAITTVLATLVSPVQDHVRRMLHLGGIPWAASAVSGTQLTSAVMFILVLSNTGVDPIWIPMGGLAFANSASTGVGLAIARLRSEGSGAEPFSLRELSSSGSWLLASSTVRNGAGVVAGALIANLATLEDLGFAEAARILSQPLLVLATGLGFALRPQSMEAAQSRSERGARETSRQYNLLLGGIGLVLIVAFGFPWTWSPVPDLLPNAYVIPGLLIVRLAANVLSGAAFPYRFELQGARLESRVARTDTLSGLGQVLVALTAPITQAFAQPLGTMAVSLGQLMGYQADLKPYYMKRRPGPGPTKVLHLAQGALGSGGGPYNIRSLAEAQASLGMQVTISGFRRKNKLSSGHSFSTQELPDRRWEDVVKRMAAQHDVVHVHGMLNRVHSRFLRASLTTGAIVFVTPRSCHHPHVLAKRFGEKLAIPGYSILKRVYAGVIDRPLLHSVDGIHVLSAYEAEIEKADGVPMWTHPYGVDEGLEVSRTLVPERTNLLFVGRLDIYQKGLDLLLEAFQIVVEGAPQGEVRLIIAGPGDQEPLTSRAIRGVDVIGPVDTTRRNSLLSEADFFVHASRWEVMARAAREALAHGVPLIASRESNFGDWTESCDMGIMTSLSVEGIAEALWQAINSTGEQRREMRHNALAFARSHRWKDLAEASQTWYLEVH